MNMDTPLVPADRLLHLLPAVYRERDLPEGRALEALLRLIGAQVELVRNDIEGLQRDFFIETCSPWVVPYIADLVGSTTLHEAQVPFGTESAPSLIDDLAGRGLEPASAVRVRADVAKTIYYRRRKGTLAMLEELARDVTGYAAHAVEFFELLTWAQHVEHLRMHSTDCIDLRAPERVDRVDGPFDEASHTIDVRAISHVDGWHNIRNIGFFLWRLRAYEMLKSEARQGAEPWQFHVSPLGNRAPLFSRWRREGDESGLATELHVPAPIRPLALRDDLERSGRRPAPRPVNTGFYGPDGSFTLLDPLGNPVHPDAVACRDLATWSRPPARFRALVSGSLAPFPALTAAAPEVAVTIGTIAAAPVPLAPVPSTLAEARTTLENGLRAAHADRLFSAARVLIVGDRLLIAPGDMSSTVSVAATGADPTTAAELKLDGGSAVAVDGAFSARLHPFPQLTAALPAVDVTIGPTGPRTLQLASRPATLSEARTLFEQALTAADPDSRFANATVLAVDDRLFVVPGAPGGRVTFAASPADAETVSQLGLLNRVAFDARNGRVAFAVGDEPPVPLLLNYHYGFPADLGGGPYARARWLVDPGRAALQLSVSRTPSSPGVLPTLTAALSEWALQGRPNTIISILDSRTYAEPLDIDLHDRHWLAIQAADRQRPHIQPAGGEIRVNPSHTCPDAQLTLSGLLVEGSVHVFQELGRLRLLHSTLVPGRGLDRDLPATPLASVVVEAADGGGRPINSGLEAQIAFSITGGLRLPPHADGVWIVDSIVEGVRNRMGQREAAVAATGTADQPGPPMTIERSTMLGPAFVRAIPLASETIFAHLVTATERQRGCVRFSYLTPGSTTPRRYRCQPDLEIASRIESAEAAAANAGTTLTQAGRAAITAEVEGWLVPAFTALPYGHPAYVQLDRTCPVQVVKGAEDGSEMGAYCHVKHAQREANLRIRVDEYLPVGLEAGVIHVT
jgi:hypothetical protein